MRAALHYYAGGIVFYGRQILSREPGTTGNMVNLWGEGREDTKETRDRRRTEGDGERERERRLSHSQILKAL